MTENKVGIIVLDYNNALATINCIKSVLKYSAKDVFQLVIIDNRSSDENINLMKEFLNSLPFKISFLNQSNYREINNRSEINYILLDHNLGYAKGNNIGVDFFASDAKINFLLIINNDIIFTENIIPTLLDFSIKTHDAALISPLLFYKDGKSIDYNCARKKHTLFQLLITYAFSYFNIFGLLSIIKKNQLILKTNSDLLLSESVKIDIPSGSCMFVEKYLFNSINGFDPNTFLYFEENILFEKIKAIAKQNYILPSISCIHIGASSTEKISTYSVAQHGVNSMFYYLNTYIKPSLIYMFVLRLFVFVFLVRVKLFSIFKHASIVR